MRRIVLRREIVQLGGIRRKLRVLHLSDVHFSPSLPYEKNLLKGKQVSDLVKAEKPDIIAVTGDLVSRTADAQSFRAAEMTITHLCSMAPVLFSVGNHEYDLPAQEREDFFAALKRVGVTVLDNSSETIEGITFTGLTLPGSVFKNENGGYSHLKPITPELVTECVGTCSAHPCILLAHSPMGFPAYTAWGADVVLSGHVHGGIVRLFGVGMLSPERKFFPKYTKGIYRRSGSVMQVSAGIGKLRVNDPSEIVCLDVVPEEKEGQYEYSTTN